MTLDAVTRCPACPIVWRNLYAVVQVVLALHDTDGEVDARVMEEAIANLRLAARHVKPLVDAHLENQAHALSSELWDARAAGRQA